MITPYFAPIRRQVALWLATLPWLHTPFREHQRAAGAGVDCVQLAGALLIQCGHLDRFEPGPYTIDAGDHEDRSRVIDWLQASPRFARRNAPIATGDLLTFRQGRCAHHVGLVLATDGLQAAFVHCHRHSGTVISELLDRTWSSRLTGVWTPIEP